MLPLDPVQHSKKELECTSINIKAREDQDPGNRIQMA